MERNTLIWNLVVNKTFRLREHLNMQFRTEVFSSLNHPSFSTPSQRTILSSTGEVGSAGADHDYENIVEAAPVRTEIDVLIA